MQYFGCSNILKNAVGFVGIIVVLAICIVPIIKLTVLSIAFNITAALSETIADKKIVSVLEQIGGTFKILLRNDMHSISNAHDRANTGNKNNK